MYGYCMKTINISLPTKLKTEAQELVEGGYYASFSDLVRDSLRVAVSRNKYELMITDAIEDEEEGKGTLLKSKREIDNYFKAL